MEVHVSGFRVPRRGRREKGGLGGMNMFMFRHMFSHMFMNLFMYLHVYRFIPMGMFILRAEKAEAPQPHGLLQAGLPLPGHAVITSRASWRNAWLPSKPGS